MKINKETIINVAKILEAIKKRQGKGIPVLPLKDSVFYPTAVKEFKFGRAVSVNAITAAEKTNNTVFIVAQRRADREYPGKGELFSVGCLGQIAQGRQNEDGTYNLIIVPLSKARATYTWGKTEKDPIIAKVKILDTGKKTAHPDAQKIKKELLFIVKKLMTASGNGRNEIILNQAKANDDVEELLYNICAIISGSDSEVDNEDKQKLLEETDIHRRLDILRRAIDLVHCDIAIKREIQSRMSQLIEENNRQVILQKQFQALTGLMKKESGSEVERYKTRIKESGMPDYAKDRAYEELDKIGSDAHPAEIGVARNWLNTALSIPWNKSAEEKIDCTAAAKVLTAGHYGLQKPKEHILEYLAVRGRTTAARTTFLCFNGPPGVGKTTLARKISEALGRPFYKIPLGGVADASELRGHRKTYVGSMPGSIVNALIRTKVNNPVILLDEIDKIRDRNYGSSASAAMLEILDPEQNSTFTDHFLDLGVDLSKVMFLCTSNSVKDIHPALHDRLDIIKLEGYTEEEKLIIAKDYVIPKQYEQNGLFRGEVSLPKKTLSDIIRYYTRESGVRELERDINKICRKVVYNNAEAGKKPPKLTVTADNLFKYLGPKKFVSKKNEHMPKIGSVNGLAWTSVGGELLPMQTLAYSGKGKINTTGNIGDIMSESVKAAFAMAKYWCDTSGINKKYWMERDFHIHFPDASTPKEGASAGSAIVTSLISTITGTKVRGDIAMTGEVELSGNVNAIGGVKEKLLAAHRYGIKNVILPEDNRRNVEEIENYIKDKFSNIYFVKHIEEVLQHALANEINVKLLADNSADGRTSAGGGDGKGMFCYRPQVN